MGLDNCSYVSFIGLVRKYKGLEVLIDSFKYLKDMNIKLIIAGEFYEPIDRYLNIIKELDLGDKIIVENNFLNSNKIRDYICACDIVIQPYIKASQSGITPVSYFYETPLIVSNVKGLKEIITLQIKLANSWTNYKLIFHELHSSSSDLIFEDEKISVHTIPLDHRIYTNGFIFKEKPFNRKLDINKVEDLNIDKAYYRKLKQGEDVINEKGEIIRNELVTLLGRSTKSYAFCSDTAYCESIIPIIFDVDVLYHESTFLEEHEYLCTKTKKCMPTSYIIIHTICMYESQ